MRQERVQRRLRQRAPRRESGSPSMQVSGPGPSTEAASAVVTRIDEVLRAASPR